MNELDQLAGLRLTDRPAIVLGIDGSKSSLRAGSYALGLARRQHAHLIAVYVRCPPSTFLTMGDQIGAVLTANAEAQDGVERSLRKAAAEDPALPGISGAFLVRYGNPYRVLSDVAREVHADAVIVGRSERTAHRLAGSVAVRLVRCGRWPVTVVP